MTTAQVYSIGKPGQKWGESEKIKWRLAQVIKRSYQAEVVVKIDALREQFDVTEYGALNYEEGLYPLYALKSRNWDRSLPTVLVTGGVHGYETSGVQGALRFLETVASSITIK